MFLLSLFYVNASIDCNLTVPTSIGNLSVLNATFNTSADGSTGNVSVFFEGRSASVRNSSFSFVANITNTSNLRHVNLTLPNSAILEDSDDWEFRATCYANASSSTITIAENVATSSTITGRLLDRTDPSSPTSITFTNPVKVDDTITATITRDTANRCYIRFGSSNAPRKAMTLSGSTCTYTVSRENPPNGAYAVFIEADDRTNSTPTNQQNVEILSATSDGGGILSGAQIQLPQSTGIQGAFGASTNPFLAKANNMLSSNPIVVILVLGLLIYIIKEL